MRRTFLDFETFWSDEYSLRRMTPIEYVMDPRFEALGCGFIHEGDGMDWVEGPDLKEYISTVDWKNTYATSHNASFDMLILSHRFEIIPGFYGDTLGMARNWLGHHLPSVALDKVAEYFGMPPKMKTVNKFKGLNLTAIRQMPALRAELKEYGLDDTIKCREIFNRILLDGFPPHELEILDMVVRMVTEPKLELDQIVLAEHLGEVKARKQALLDEAFLTKDTLSSIMSDQQLATKLLFLGVDPIPTKLSKTTGKQAFAFAKSDKAFTELLEHEEPMVQALVAARLGHKSTLEETRTERMLAISRVTPVLPVPLKYSGAHTHKKFSGDWKINAQNFPRGSKLRKALRAPKGKLIVAVDASQIEARFNAELSGQDDLCELFRKGEDVYASFAYYIYQREINKQRDPQERFVGKTGILSLGYGSSWPVFQNMCRVQGGVLLTDAEAASVVHIYRQRYKQIVANWHYANNVVLPRLHGISGADEIANSIVGGRTDFMRWGPLKIYKGSIELPNGNRLRYRDLRHEHVQGAGFQWMFMRGATRQKIYGAKLVENVIQALAFVHIMEAAVRIKKLTQGLLMPAHQNHDELIYVVEERHADQVKQLVVQEMSRPPEWMPNAPLAAEGHIAIDYGAAK